jgi:hypothetical protein
MIFPLRPFFDFTSIRHIQSLLFTAAPSLCITRDIVSRTLRVQRVLIEHAGGPVCEWPCDFSLIQRYAQSIPVHSCPSIAVHVVRAQLHTSSRSTAFSRDLHCAALRPPTIGTWVGRDFLWRGVQKPLNLLLQFNPEVRTSNINETYQLFYETS